MSSKRCSNCGHMTPSDSTYCVECGALQAAAPPIPSRVSKRPPIKMRSVYIVIMFVSLAIGASLGYFFGLAISPPMPTTVTVTSTRVSTFVTITTTTAIPTLGSEELSGVLLVNTLKAVYRLDMRSSAKPRWELFMNVSVKPEQISPDGRYLAYNVPKSGIYIMDMATGESHILLKHRESTSVSCLSWNPDGSMISYQSDGNYVLDPSGKTRVIDKPRPSRSYSVIGKRGVTADVSGELGCPTWAGASTLLYQRFAGPWPRYANLTCIGDFCWGTIDADTTTVATLTSYGVTLRNLPQRWFVEKASSNAVLLRDKNEGGLLYLVQSSYLKTAGGKRPSPLSFCETSDCLEAHFSPDEREIAFLVESGVNKDLILVDVTAPETTTTILLGNRFIKSLSWSPNGRDMILNEATVINMFDLETRKERSILAASPSLLIWGTSWSRDGDYLAVLGIAKVGAPKDVRDALCIVRVADSAYYLLPPLPEGTKTPEVLSWLAGSP